MLVGRSVERSRIDQLLDGARAGMSGSLLITGDAGIGKSALLRYARDHAPGFTVLAARGVESESEIAFSGVADILRPVLDHIKGIAEPQGAALIGALALGPPVAADPFTISAATLSTLAAAADEAPVLVLVDDLQWLDSESARSLLFVARRIEAESVVVLLAARAGEAPALDMSGLSSIELPGLDPPESLELLDAFVAHPIAAPVADRLVGSTGGNPLALLEIPTLLTRGQLSGRRELADPLPAGPSIEQAFERQIKRLPSSTRSALAVAAANDGDSIETTLEVLMRLGIPESALEPAEAEGLLVSDGATVDFRHPLLRSCAYHRASPAEKRAAHLGFAEVLNEAGADARSAWHRASATVGTNEEVAEALERAGREAAARTGHAAAARAFERAAQFTPDPKVRANRLLQAAGSLQLAGRPDRAVELLELALDATSDPLVRADIQTVRGRVEVWRGAPMKAHAMLVSEVAAIEELDPARAAVMLATATTPCFMAAELTLARETAERAIQAGAASGGLPALFSSVLLGSAMTLLGDGPEARPLLDDALAFIAESESVLPLHELAGLVAVNLVWLEDYDDARAVIDRLIGEGRSLSAPAILPFVLGVNSELEFRTGRWAAAHADAAEAYSLARETGQLNTGSYTLVNLARAEAAVGRATECRAHADEALRIAAQLGVESIPVYAQAALGLLALGTGNPQEAAGHLEQVAVLAESQRLGEPNAVQWGPDLVEAYFRSGRVDAAAEALTTLERQAEATNRGWAKSAAARCRGLLAHSDFARHFEVALELQAQPHSAFERARTRLCYGARLAKTDQIDAATDQLQSAAAIFEQLGATPWLESTKKMLADIGARHTPGVVVIMQLLTHQELQVAKLVAQGHTNKEAAAALFVSPKTIEAHLGSIYKKLEIRSRTDLARIMAGEGGLLDPSRSPASSAG
jgi:DNA-binding CsgD family transcriptional regulator